MPKGAGFLQNSGFEVHIPGCPAYGCTNPQCECGCHKWEGQNGHLLHQLHCREDRCGPTGEFCDCPCHSGVDMEHSPLEVAIIAMMRAGGIDDPRPDAVAQMAEVFLPCLRKMCDSEHPWDGLWKESGLFGALTDARKKFQRYWHRTWVKGIRHDDSGYDLINFLGFSLRAPTHSRWGDWGEPGEVRQDEGYHVTHVERFGE